MSLTIVGLVLTFSLATTREGLHTFRSADGKLSLQFRSFVLSHTSDGDQHIVMTGGVDASSLAQGLRIKASRADALVATVKNHSIFRSVHASGQVVLVKTAETPTSKRSTTLNCSVANFERGTDVSTVTGIGQVRIVDMDSNKHQVLVATGSRCTAKLTSQEKTKGDPLRSAVLEGPVTVQVDQAPEKPNAKPGTVIATSDRLEYANAGSTATITLLGNVRM